MKKLENNSIIVGFLFAIGFFIFFVSYITFSLYPNILDIEEKKEDLKNKISYFNRIEKKGFNFTEFKVLNSVNPSSISNSKLKELLNDDFYKKINKDFDENFYNSSIYEKSYEEFTGTGNFIEYLNSKDNELDSILKGQEFNEKLTKIYKVLPKYSEYLDIESEKNLSDLAFINYIENLLNKYNLTTKDSIGIKSLVAVSNDVVSDEDNLYYIPLKLEIEGSKLSILNFLRNIKNTGDIKFKGDDFEFSDKLGATSQISEVERVEFKKYIDDSFDLRTVFDSSLEKFLSETNQANDLITIEVDLKFYVSGISTDKIREKIEYIIGRNNKKIIFDDEGNPRRDEKTGKIKYELVHYNYSNLLNIVKRLRSNPSLNKNTYYRKKVDNIFKYLNSKELKKEFANIKKSIAKGEDIDKTYKKAEEYKTIFLKLDREIYEIAKSLGLDTDKIDEETGKVIQKSIYPENYIFENK